MLILLSPAKSLKMDRALASDTRTKPRFDEQTSALIEVLKAKSAADIKGLMGLSDKLAQLNYDRYQGWQQAQAAQAIAAFDGDVYSGLDAESLSADALEYAQAHMRMLSGLYGLLRPLDAMRPYRLEMGTKLGNAKGEDLYDFWGDQLAEQMNADAKAAGASHIVNLASNEYFKAACAKKLAFPVVTPVFKERKDGALKLISFYAKKARGTMARWIIEHQVEDAKALERFAEDGYRFEAADPKKGELLFTRNSTK